jgi:hypothetical protein
MKMIFIFALPECIVSIIIQFRAISSVGSEHLPYKQGVTGSNPVSPTEKAFPNLRKGFFILHRAPFMGARMKNEKVYEHSE